MSPLSRALSNETHASTNEPDSRLYRMRIPMKSATHYDAKPTTDSNRKTANG
jgi:hypothetical protein